MDHSSVFVNSQPSSTDVMMHSIIIYDNNDDDVIQ